MVTQRIPQKVLTGTAGVAVVDPEQPCFFISTPRTEELKVALVLSYRGMRVAALVGGEARERGQADGGERQA